MRSTDRNRGDGFLQSGMMFFFDGWASSAVLTTSVRSGSRNKKRTPGSSVFGRAGVRCFYLRKLILLRDQIERRNNILNGIIAHEFEFAEF